MGPLTLADFIGLDTCLFIMQVLHRDLADSKYRPCPLLANYVHAGYLGVKSGRGFYEYKPKKWYEIIIDNAYKYHLAFERCILSMQSIIRDTISKISNASHM